MRRAVLLLLLNLLLLLQGCATHHRAPAYGFSRPSSTTEDERFFFGSFLRDSR